MLGDDLTVEIRVCSDSDIPALAELMTDLGYPTSPEQMSERMRVIRMREDFATLVADDSGRIVGMVGACINPYYEEDGAYGRIVALVVSPAFQRRHAGARLVARAEMWLASRGAQRVIINSGDKRVGAHAFYRSLGYRATGVRLVRNLEQASAL